MNTTQSTKKSVAEKSVAEKSVAKNSYTKWSVHYQDIGSLLVHHLSHDRADATLCEHLETTYKPGIQKILCKGKPKTTVPYDILNTSNMFHVLKMLSAGINYNMKKGVIAQFMLGNYGKFANLHQGHPSGLDIVCHWRKIAIELKNRDNTDNSSSRSANLSKLHKFQEQYPDYLCLYGPINSDTEALTQAGRSGVYRCGDKMIPYLTGRQLLDFIMGGDTDRVVDFTKDVMEEYYNRPLVREMYASAEMLEVEKLQKRVLELQEHIKALSLSCDALTAELQVKQEVESRLRGEVERLAPVASDISTKGVILAAPFRGVDCDAFAGKKQRAEKCCEATSATAVVKCA